MEVCHFSLFAPNLSGLFSYVIDQIKHERKQGIDSIFINSDVENPDPKRFNYEGIVAEPWSRALESDVWVLHRSIPAKLIPHLAKKKNLAVLHGTSSILILHDVESNGKTKKFDMHVEFMKTFKKVVAITKSDYQIMKLYGNNVEYIADAVDMDKYDIASIQPYPFRFRPAIISTTNIRINKHPAYLLWSIPEIRKRIPTARLNMFGLNVAASKPWDDLVLKSNEISNSMEHYAHKFSDLRMFLAGSDISFNANYNGIFSRDSIEAMAFGNSIVATTNEHTPYVYNNHIPSIVEAVCSAWEDLKSNPEKQIRLNIDYARETFCMSKAVKKFINLYNSL